MQNLPSGNSQRELSMRLLRDMQQRNLSPGERYITAAEAARFLNVSPATANRAMQFLETQKILERRPRMGTMVGEAFEQAKSERLQTILILHPEIKSRRSNINFNEFINAATKQFPGAAIQIFFLPTENQLGAAHKIFNAATESGKVAGVIAISCSAKVYNFFANENIPLVVFGSLYPGQNNLQAVTPDLYKAGELLADHLISRGHKKLALLVHSQGRPGDDQFLTGIMEAMTKHKLTPNALLVQLASPELEQFKQQVQGLIKTEKSATGILLQSRRLAEDFSAALKSNQAASIEIGFYDHATEQVEKSPFAHVQSEMAYEKIATFIVEHLAQQTKDKGTKKSEIHLPVVLRKNSR